MVFEASGLITAGSRGRVTIHDPGLNQLQRNGTLPTVWIPPGELRDQRDLPRTRMVFVRRRTHLKNRNHAALAIRRAEPSKSKARLR